MRRLLYIVVILLVASPIVIWYKTARVPKEVAISGVGVRLTNRPPKFCPQNARVVVTTASSITQPVFEGVSQVRSCDLLVIEGQAFDQTVSYHVFVAIKGARSFEAIVPGPLTTFVNYPIQVGDINSDNSIDEDDRKAIEVGLKDSTQAVDALDVDGDGQLTILDYSLVATNQGAGVPRPDAKLWEASR